MHENSLTENSVNIGAPKMYNIRNQTLFYCLYDAPSYNISTFIEKLPER